MADVTILDAPIDVEGTLIKRVLIRRDEEHFHEVSQPDRFIVELRRHHVAADLFVFTQLLPNTRPQFPYYFEWDNVAAVPITTYDDWLSSQTQSGTRKQIKRAEKRGITVTLSPLDETLARGVREIFNETPIRQGRPYPYFGADLETVTTSLARHSDRSDFICAYHDTELVGLIKFIHVGCYARASITIAKLAHRDKAAMNAMIAFAVRLGAERQYRFLVYGKYEYGSSGADGLTDFKRHNGFVRLDLPRYFIPLSARGRVALALGLHKPTRQRLPVPLNRVLRSLRSSWYARRGMGRASSPEGLG